MSLDFTNRSILKGAADAIRTHNYIHNRAERNAVLITEYLNFAADLIEGLANGDIVVVRHGRWVEDSIELDKRCSCCNKIHGTIYEKEPFCPNCGARMDATDTNDDKGETIL